MKQDIKPFESKKVRTAWNEQKEDWYFSIVDVIEVLTDSPCPRKYWNALKTKLQTEGSELSQFLGQLKLKSEDGKNYLTDVANTQQILRLVQSVPSKKAEPFKLSGLPKSALNANRKKHRQSAVSQLNAKSGVMIGKDDTKVIE